MRNKLAGVFLVMALLGLGAVSCTRPPAGGSSPTVAATAGGPEEPVRYTGKETVDWSHEGGLRLAVGVKSHQVFRANRAHPELAEDYGWTYNHAPMMAYWNGRFYLEYLSAPVDENRPPMQTLLTTSADGESWEKPKVAFPQITLKDGRPGMMHQRMGFYLAPNGRFLVVAFYAAGSHPNDGSGVGRVVREIYQDGSYSPIYYVRYNSHNGFSAANTGFPFYTGAPDAGFKDACTALLADKLVTMAWWEEDRSTDGFSYPMGRALKALSFYRRKDGAVVGLWKSSWASITRDNGGSWSKPVEVASLVMAEAKVWGQQTADGRYALLYNPRKDNRHRWPLAIVTGDDGIHFDNMLTVQGEVAPRRYNGLDKAFGPQYVRGLEASDGNPPGGALWLSYSMNKDDIWVSRIPVPVRGKVDRPVRDTFEGVQTTDLDWNLYSPRWAPVRIAEAPDPSNHSLELQDREPCDYARATRVFPESERLTVRFRILAKQNNTGRLEVELTDRYGYRPPVRLYLDSSARLLAADGNRNDLVQLQQYRPGTWYAIELRIDVGKGLFAVLVDGRRVLERAELLDPVSSLERISFRTGPFRSDPSLRVPKSPGEDIPGADEAVVPATYWIDDLEVIPQTGPVPARGNGRE